MPIEKTKRISFLRALEILVLGLVSGIQLSLYLYDNYDDGIADYRSLLIGLLMLLISVGFVIFTFWGNKSENSS